jgi:hypothetical protein
LLVLAALTVKTARSGVWLLFVAATPAARGWRVAPARTSRMGIPALVTAVALTVLGIAHGPISTGASRRLLDDALRRAAGTPILAEGVPAEQVAAAGGRVWLSNPIDAFRHRDQRLYLDWLAGRPAGDRALEKARVVLVIRRDKPAERLGRMQAFAPVAHDENAILFVRRR